MAKRKPILIEDEPVLVDGSAVIADVVEEGVQSVSTHDGKLISRRDFARTPVPDGMRMNYSPINKGASRLALLQQDIRLLNRALAGFEPPADGSVRRAASHASGDYVVVENLPLPDGYRPDTVNIAVVTTGYPDRPPVGIHLMRKGNEQVVEQLKSYFRHTFDEAVISEAEYIPGYIWVCYHYANHRWRFNPGDIRRGDNLTKYLDNFYNELLRAV